MGAEMRSHYTQFLLRTDRPTQAYGAVDGLDIYLFPHTAAGTLACERTSEALDVRIVNQVASGISWQLGRGWPVLAIAGGGKDQEFWCGLFDGGGGVPLFEHNRLIGPTNFEWNPASPSEVEILCSSFRTDTKVETVYDALTRPGYESALERHGALARVLGLPQWSVGMGYSRIVGGALPPEAGTPRRPPRLREQWPIPEWITNIKSSDLKDWFQQICQKAFKFLEDDFGFHRDPPRLSEPGYQNPYMVFYRRTDLIVVIEAISHVSRIRLCLIDREGRLLDLTSLVKHRDPRLLDLCSMAGTRDQILIFAEALWNCAVDVLDGDLRAISRGVAIGPGFSFSIFYSQSDLDHFLADHGPRPGSALARIE